jgi:hypothetical protein
VVGAATSALLLVLLVVEWMEEASTGTVLEAGVAEAMDGAVGTMTGTVDEGTGTATGLDGSEADEE